MGEEVTYTCGATRREKAFTTADPREAARLFVRVPANEQPYIIRSVKREGGQTSASCAASTWTKGQEYIKDFRGGRDQALIMAIAEEQRLAAGARETSILKDPVKEEEDHER